MILYVDAGTEAPHGCMASQDLFSFLPRTAALCTSTCHLSVDVCLINNMKAQGSSQGQCHLYNGAFSSLLVHSYLTLQCSPRHVGKNKFKCTLQATE